MKENKKSEAERFDKEVEQPKKAYRMLPRCETKEVEIISGVMSEVDLACDTGIR